MGLKARILPNYTYEEYLQWEGEWELIEGIPYSMSPAASPYHQILSSRLNILLGNQLNSENCDCEVYQPIDLKLTENTVIQPDLLIVCNPIEKQYLDFPPELVVEILSPSTKLKDLNTKFELYQNFGIPYYLIIDPEEKTIEVFKLEESGKYKETSLSDGLLIHENCSIHPELESIFN